MPLDDDGRITAKVDHSMPLGCCAVTVNSKVVYAGPIKGAGPALRNGAVIYLHPDDFAHGQTFMKKQVN